MEARGQRYLSSSTTLHLMFLRPGLSLIPELTEWLHWQVNELWGPTCLPCTPELGLQTHPTTPHFFSAGSENPNAGPRVRERDQLNQLPSPLAPTS